LTKSVLFIGYGDLAQRAAKHLSKAGWQVFGACRTPETKVTHAGVTLLTADASNEQDLYQLFQQSYDAVVVTLTPAGRDDDAYHRGYVVPCRHLQQVLSQQAVAPRLLYISSTSVYGQTDGEWVNEDSPTAPSSNSGRSLLQAEQVIAASNAQVSLLRCSGIYGPGRTMLQQRLLNGRATITPAWTNRIHSDDVAGFISYLLTHPEQQQPVYLVTDSQPLLQEDVYKRYAEVLGVNIDALERRAEVGPRGSKRLSNARLLKSGYQLQYPQLTPASIQTN
jgi:nucleoside-diphosphate-sugar epimerase